MTGNRSSVPWRPLGETGKHYWLVQRMAKACGVDAALAVEQGDLSLGNWAEVVHGCRSCQWADGCKRWLGKHDGKDPSPPPNACINANLIKRLSERQRQ